jgi:hypothetical protein
MQHPGHANPTTRTRHHRRLSQQHRFSDIDFVWDISTNTPVVGDWDGNGSPTAGYLTPLDVFDLHSTNAAAGSDNMFAFVPTGGKPVAGKWIAPSKPLLSGVISGAQPGSSGSNEGGGDAD